MSLMMLVYIAGIVNGVAATGFIASMFSWAMVVVLSMISSDHEVIVVKGKWLILPILLTIFTMALPSKETIYLMAAASIGEKIATSEKVNVIFDKMYKIVEKELDDKLKPAK